MLNNLDNRNTIRSSSEFHTTQRNARDQNIFNPNLIAFRERKAQAEKFFMENPPKQTLVEQKDGSKVLVLSQNWEVPKKFKTEKKDTLRINIYVPGMFQADQPNLGNHPLESKFTSALLRGNADAVYILKAEGLNSFAYCDKDKKPHTQSNVANAAVQILDQDLLQLKKKLNLDPNIPVEFEIAGYSEGSSQGASIAEKIIENNIGKVTGYTSIGGGGLVGYEDQNKANIIDFVQDAFRKMKHLKSDEMIKKGIYWIQEDPHTFFVTHELIGDPIKGGFEYSLGKAKVDTFSDIKNITRWAIRYATHMMGFQKGVPNERVQAACSINPDYSKLAEKGVPIIVLAGTEEIFFPSDDVHNAVNKLRKIGGKVLLVTSNIPHEFPHNNPFGTAYLFGIFRDKCGF